MSIDRLRLLRPVKFKDSVVSIKPNPFVQLTSASLVLDCPSSRSFFVDHNPMIATNRYRMSGWISNL